MQFHFLGHRIEFLGCRIVHANPGKAFGGQGGIQRVLPGQGAGDFFAFFVNACVDEHGCIVPKYGVFATAKCNYGSIMRSIIIARYDARGYLFRRGRRLQRGRTPRINQAP